MNSKSWEVPVKCAAGGEGERERGGGRKGERGRESKKGRERRGREGERQGEGKGEEGGEGGEGRGGEGRGGRGGRGGEGRERKCMFVFSVACASLHAHCNNQHHSLLHTVSLSVCDVQKRRPHPAPPQWQCPISSQSGPCRRTTLCYHLQ